MGYRFVQRQMIVRQFQLAAAMTKPAQRLYFSTLFPPIFELVIPIAHGASAAAWRCSPQSAAPRLGGQLGGRSAAGLILSSSSYHRWTELNVHDIISHRWFTTRLHHVARHIT
jgi:hypothetical protein